MLAVAASSCLLAASAFVVRPPLGSGPGCAARSDLTMLFGGGGGGGEGGGMNMMETIKKAQQVGVKVKELQEELANTEIEATAAEGGVTVTISGAQVPISVAVTDEMIAQGSLALSEAVSLAAREAHGNSVEYAKSKMSALYQEIGLPMPGQAPPQ